MRATRVAVFAFVLVCAFAIGGFVDLACAATLKVIVTPSDPAVKLGGTQQFTAKVSGVKNASVTWSLDSTSVTNGIQISSGGKVTVPTSITITPDSFKPVVTATYTGVTPNVSGTATFTITDPSPPPGLFIVTLNCTGGACNSNDFDLALNVEKNGTIGGLVMQETELATFTGAIILKTNTFQATFKNSYGTFSLVGDVEYNGGTAETITGTLHAPHVVEPIGTWTVTPTTTGLAKVGTFTITDKSLFGVVINGTLGGMAIPPSTNAFFGVVEVPAHKVTAPINGTYNQTSATVAFNSSLEVHGNTFDISGSGTISANGDISGDMVYDGHKVGTWSLHNP